MIRTAFFAGAIVIISIARDVSAQSRPDFSGRWVEAAAGQAGGGRAGGAAGAGGAAAATGRAGADAGQVAGGARRGGGGGGAAGRGGRNPGSGWGANITIAQDSAKLTLQYELFGRGDMQPPVIYHYNLNGTDSNNRFLLGWGVEERVSRARWNADTLVITTRFTSPDPSTGVPASTQLIQALVLENATTLVVQSTRPGADGSQPIVSQTTYTKM